MVSLGSVCWAACCTLYPQIGYFEREHAPQIESPTGLWKVQCVHTQIPPCCASPPPTPPCAASPPGTHTILKKNLGYKPFPKNSRVPSSSPLPSSGAPLPPPPFPRPHFTPRAPTCFPPDLTAGVKGGDGLCAHPSSFNSSRVLGASSRRSRL